MAMGGGEEDNWTAFSGSSEREWTQFSDSAETEESVLEMCFPLLPVSVTLTGEELLSVDVK